ncbi:MULTISPECIES: hypothetical protein [unclassified Jeotgalibaca]|uniref:hypothetical protein n=1 Tax=unclassified Jeotgalibaca TaxID=2621505 RepID=UPI003FD54ECC
METKIYLLLTDTGSLLSQTIKQFTKQKYNHCSLAFDLELDQTYSFGRKQPWNPLNGGFVQEDVHSDFFMSSDCALYSLIVTDEQKNKMIRFIEKTKQQENEMKYNFLGLVAANLEIEWQREYHYFCSEFVATTLTEGGVFFPSKPLSFIAPYDLIDALPLELIFEGTVYEYIQMTKGIWLATI